jgi:hypothetical protein
MLPVGLKPTISAGETSSIGAPYIHDIRSLRVNDLTLILLTWRKW